MSVHPIDLMGQSKDMDLKSNAHAITDLDYVGETKRPRVLEKADEVKLVRIKRNKSSDGLDTLLLQAEGYRCFCGEMSPQRRFPPVVTLGVPVSRPSRPELASEVIAKHNTCVEWRDHYTLGDAQ